MPVTEHTDAIEKNIQVADETWKDLIAHVGPNSQEAKVVAEIQPIYQNFVSEVLRPAMSPLAAGDFTTESASTFLKGDASNGSKMHKPFDELAEDQQHAVKEHYETSLASSARLRNLSITIMVIGSALALLAAILTIRSIVGPLTEMRAAIDRAANQNDFTGSIKVAGQNEIADTAHAFNTMMTTLRTSLTDLKQNMVSVDNALMTLATSSEQAAKASTSTSESARMRATTERFKV
ncbi:MAG: hypothetical protein CVU33_20035 [Betaproteobacteria bacterium HGW-Betaproteobacteria-6]|nr:MAG: hypothetical protein CVU33_20035 [Betaproteobacteria bacterium HGW-Betaproteobacteria-6]